MSHPQHGESLKHLCKFILVFLCVSLLVFAISQAKPRELVTIESFTEETISVDVKGTIFSLSTDELLRTKLKYPSKEQEQSGIQDFLSWLQLKGNDTSSLLNEHYLAKEIYTWEEELGLKRPSEGTVALTNGVVTFTLPHEGVSIDARNLSRSLERLAKAKESERSYTVFARTISKKPKTNERDFMEFVDDLRLFVSRDFTLYNSEFNVEHTIGKNDLRHLITVSFDENQASYDAVVNEAYLHEVLQNYNREVQDAGFSVEEYIVSVVPSRVGISLNTQETKEHIQKAIHGEQDRALIAFTSTEPELTTDEAEALSINHLVSSFTTYYSCCEARARNIQAVAKLLDGVIVQPGETFSLNTFIGRRTAERGFEPAGTIVKGSMIETIGGGISQFATTFYNTLYWGGYQDISHTPHSRYFSRYPEGIEATISWPEPHLIFKNNTENGILIKTKAGETFLTVYFFSDNDGRIVTGKHEAGTTKITIVDEGGEQSRIVESKVENKTDIYPPKEIYYVDPLVEANAIFTKTQGRSSYSVDVTRSVTQGEEVISQRTWKVFYLSEDKEFLVNSCDIVPPEGICKTKEDLENEKKELEDFFQQLEDGL